MAKIPLFDLSELHSSLHDPLLAAFESVLSSGNFILGEVVERLEKEFAASLGVKHALGVSSGTDAILLALMTLGIEPGDEVLCPTFTFFATAGCVARLGAIPVWVDVLPEDFNLNMRDAEEKLSRRTKAIIPVHLFGQCCDMDAVKAFSKSNGLFMIEDVAQAHGAKYKNQQAGTFGHLGAFSFYPTKNLGGFGDGGLLVTNDDDLAKKARLLRTHGSQKQYFHEYVGGNFRLDAIQAALLRVKLPLLNEFIDKRRANAAYYEHSFQILSSHIGMPLQLPQRFHTWNQYTLRVFNGKRDALKEFLASHGIDSAVYYPSTLDEQPCFKTNSALRGTKPKVAHELTQEVLSLPVFPGLKEKELSQVSETIKQFFKSP